MFLPLDALQYVTDAITLNRRWHWQARGMSLHGACTAPLLAPRVTASKHVVAVGYRFSVAVRLPFLGEVLSCHASLHLAEV